MANEKIVLNYFHQTNYNNTPLNIIGANSNLTLRTIPSNSDSDTKYVKKWGTEYKIISLTNAVITTPRGVSGTNEWKWEFRGADTDTLFGYVTDNGSSIFTAGSAVSTAEQLIIKLVWIMGSTAAIVDNDTLTLTTNADTGGINWAVSAETLTASGAIDLYAAWEGNTYYDSLMKYGGGRLTPSGVKRNPYHDISSAISALGGAFVNVCVLDSETYDEEIDLNTASSFLFSELGEIPIITRGIGARYTREQTEHFNNYNSYYFNENGSNTTGDGTWLKPYETIDKIYSTYPTTTKNFIYGGFDASSYYEKNVTSFIKPTNKNKIETEYNRILKYVLTANDNFGDAGKKSGLILEVRNSFYNSSYCVRQSEIMKDCTLISNTSYVIYGVTTLYGTTIKFERCIIQGVHIGSWQNATNKTVEFEKCIFKNNSYAITFNGNFTGTKLTDCIFQNNDRSVYDWAISGSTGTLTFRNNVFYQSLTIGIHLTGGTYSETIENNIFLKNNYAVNSLGSITIDYNCFYENTTDKSSSVTSTNEIITDPVLCDVDNFRFGLSSESSCYRTGKTSDDLGPILRIIKISANDIVINGIIVDGQEFFNNGIYKLTQQTGSILKWVDIKNSNGIGFDDFGTAINNTEIQNTKIYNNCDGWFNKYEANEIKESLIYNNLKIGLKFLKSTTISKCVIYGNFIGIKTGAILTIINCIINKNLSYGIYSSISFSLTYCDITDAILNIDITDDSNINDNPLFISTVLNSENFNIKTIEAGYTFNSTCKNAASDDTDMGAYIMSRNIADDYWQRLRLTYNPRFLPFGNKVIDYKQFINLFAHRRDWAKAHKRTFEFRYDTNQFSNETDRKTLEFISTLIQTEENEISNEQTKIRVNFLPSAGLISGNGTINNKILIDSNLNLIKNEFKGFSMGIKYSYAASKGNVSATLKTLTLTFSTGFTMDQWVGYYFPYNGYFYYITSNTSTVFHLSDPDNTLINATNIAWSLEKYFKINSNEKTSFLLEDDDSILPSGSYNYIIRFIVCKIANSNFSYRQARYWYEKETWKTGYKLLLEEE